MCRNRDGVRVLTRPARRCLRATCGEGAKPPLDALTNRCFLVRFSTARAFSSVGRALPLQGRGRRFEPVNAHRRNPCSAGVSARLGELDNGVLDTLRTRIGRDLFVECFRGSLVGALVEVSVDVQNRANRGVAETVGDDFGVLSLGDEERYLGVPKCVGSEILV